MFDYRLTCDRSLDKVCKHVYKSFYKLELALELPLLQVGSTLVPA